MNHPIYRDAEVNSARKIYLSRFAEAGFEKTMYDTAMMICKKENMVGQENSIMESLIATMTSYLIQDDIATNGHVLIKVKKDDWVNSTSEKTIATIDIDKFQFPFKAGVIELDGIFVEYSVRGNSLMITYEITDGRYMIELTGGKTIGESMIEINATDRNSQITYAVLSVLLYIATFNTKARVHTQPMPINQGSKRKTIPKHKVNIVTLKQKSHTENSGGTKNKKNDKTWLVRGHWRNQWYSKEGVNKPIWMSPFWKGDGKEQVEKIYKV